MILPKAAGLGGCTVVSYYRILLQKAAEYELGSTGPSKPCRPPETTLLLIHHHSLASSFSNATLSASGLLSQSLQRSQHEDCTLTPTPPWQQSLGLVTSSAEQEEGYSTQDKTPHVHHHVRGCLENHKATEERTLLSPLSLEHRTYSSPSFAKYPHTSIEKAVEKNPILTTWFSPTQPGHKRGLSLSYKAKRFSTRQLAKTFLSSSLAWDDLPFSESLAEFLGEENKDFDIVSETDPHLKVQNQKETVRNNLEIRSQDMNLSIESTSFYQSNTDITESHSLMLLDITNKPALNNGGDKHDLSDQVCKNSVGCLNKSQARSICFHQCNQEDEEASSLSFENKEEEQLEGDTYNCSADLFGSSVMIEMNTKTLSMYAETVRTTSEACMLLSSPDKQHLRNEKAGVPHSTPDKQKLKSNKHINRDSLIQPGTQDLDFIPPAQSTPIVKAAVVSGSPASSYSPSTLGEFSSQPDCQDLCAFYSDLPELDSRNPARITSSQCRLNTVSANQLSQCVKESTKENLVWGMTSSRHDHRLTPKKRFWESNKHKDHMFQQHLTAKRGDLNLGSTLMITNKCDSSVCDVTVCEYKDNEVIVPPTPAAKTRLNVKFRRRRQTDKSSGDLESTWKAQQGDGVNCKRTLLDQTFTSSQRGLIQTGNCDSEIVDEGSLDGSSGYLLDDENQACDWSRDLFSNSV
ncbi:uncharacterized protein ddias isoform X2 [Xiphias gladius]|nr:uncharacterized protein ddias isoform X2 [Xiphias gladius]